MILHRSRYSLIAALSLSMFMSTATLAYDITPTIHDYSVLYLHLDLHDLVATIESAPEVTLPAPTVSFYRLETRDVVVHGGTSLGYNHWARHAACM